MSLISNLFSGGISKTIDSTTKLIDEIYTSEEEKLDKKIILERINEKLSVGQIELNKLESQHRSLFIAGWRPAIGWTCVIGLFYEFIVAPFLIITGIGAPLLDSESLHSLIVALLGMGVLRTYEKQKKVSN